MDQKRDFTHDPEQFGYAEGAKFLSKLHENGQHFVPIVDAAIYAPNPENPDDAYTTFDRGVEANAFMLNPNGSLYYGAVWPGYTGRFPTYQLIHSCCLHLSQFSRTS
jgi:alpha-glucosidase